LNPLLGRTFSLLFGGEIQDFIQDFFGGTILLGHSYCVLTGSSRRKGGLRNRGVGGTRMVLGWPGWYHSSRWRARGGNPGGWFCDGVVLGGDLQVVFGISCGWEFYSAAPRGPDLLCFLQFWVVLGGFGPLFLRCF
jgi:hypothetical protein